jgi:hypothetical protein
MKIRCGRQFWIVDPRKTGCTTFYVVKVMKPGINSRFVGYVPFGKKSFLLNNS